MGWLQDISQSIAPGQPLNILLFSAGIIFFCFFYTALMFNPKDVAEKPEEVRCLYSGHPSR
ncbi:hypothetical protein ACFS4T_31035 [Pseudomonas lini]